MAHAAQSHQEEVRGYLKVFGSLMVLTIITVTLAGLKVGIVTGVVLALIVATLKASLVVSFFMHVLHEVKSINVLLILVLFLFVSMIVLIAIGNYSVPEGTKNLNMDPKYAIHSGHDTHGHKDDSVKDVSYGTATEEAH